MDLHEPDDGIPVMRKSAFPEKQQSERMASPGSSVPRNFSGEPEDAYWFSGNRCPGGMTLACCVYRTIRKSEDICRD